jgi:hypothetical protein
MRLTFELKDIDDGSDVPIINYCKRLTNERTNATKLDVCRNGRVDIIVNDIKKASQLRVSDSRFIGPGRRAGASTMRYSEHPGRVVTT